MADGVIVLLTIESVDTKIINGTDEEGNPTKTVKMSVKDVSGKKYSYFVDESDGNWGQSLSAGNRVYAYMWTKESTFKGKKIVYHNISKPRDEMPPVPTLDAKGIPLPPPPIVKPEKLSEPPAGFFENIPPEKDNGDRHVTYNSDKDIKIRWMNSLNNANNIVCAIIQRSKELPPEETILHYQLDYANRIYLMEPGMTLDTMPISKSQTIKLHEIAKSFGLNKEDYHTVLKAITGKTIAKTTDLTYNDAVECILQFDNVMKKGDVFNKPPVERAPITQKQEDEFDNLELPF